MGLANSPSDYDLRCLQWRLQDLRACARSAERLGERMLLVRI